MDITEAVKLAKSHIDAHPDFAGMSPRRLEEAELGEDTNNWLVTISIVRQGGHEGHGSHEQNRQGEHAKVRPPMSAPAAASLDILLR